MTKDNTMVSSSHKFENLTLSEIKAPSQVRKSMEASAVRPSLKHEEVN